jgi:hypothetical protein
MIDLEKIGEGLEQRGKKFEEIKPMSIRRFSWELHKLIFRVAVFAGVVAWVASHGH